MASYSLRNRTVYTRNSLRKRRAVKLSEIHMIQRLIDSSDGFEVVSPPPLFYYFSDGDNEIIYDEPYVTVDMVLMEWGRPYILDISRDRFPIHLRRDSRMESMLYDLDSVGRWLYFVLRFRYFGDLLTLEEQDRVLLWVFWNLCSLEIIFDQDLSFYLDIIKMTPVVPLANIATDGSVFFPHVVYDAIFAPRSSKERLEINDFFQKW